MVILEIPRAEAMKLETQAGEGFGGSAKFQP